MVDGALASCGVADFQFAVERMHSFLAGRSAFVQPEVQSYGFQPVPTDPQISTVAIAAPSVNQISTTAIAMPQGQAAPGALVNVQGANLGPAAQTSGAPLPRSLASTYVAVEGVRAPLAMTSTGQIELQMPGDLPAGNANIVVSVAGEMSNTFVASIQPVLPAILAIVHQADGSAVSESNPAVAGEALIVYMAGLGAVNGDLSFGAAAPAMPPATTQVEPQVTLGNMPMSVIFSGLTPGTVGLYQVTVEVPSTLPPGGSASLTVTAGSPSASMPVAIASI
jgi:uncharacterized protein (TIGR03437 family)